MRLEDKTALVTGGASGIGKATVMELARCGATVICADVDAKKGAELEREAAIHRIADRTGRRSVKVGRARALVAPLLARKPFLRFGPGGLCRKQRIVLQEIAQGQRAEAGAAAHQEVPARQQRLVMRNVAGHASPPLNRRTGTRWRSAKRGTGR